jgi:hypothetical protein
VLVLLRSTLENGVLETSRLASAYIVPSTSQVYQPELMSNVLKLFSYNPTHTFLLESYNLVLFSRSTWIYIGQPNM